MIKNFNNHNSCSSQQVFHGFIPQVQASQTLYLSSAESAQQEEKINK